MRPLGTNNAASFPKSFDDFSSNTIFFLKKSHMYSYKFVSNRYQSIYKISI